MSRELFVGALARFAGGRRGRLIWLALTVAAVLGVVGSFLIGGGSKDEAVSDAAARAKRYAEVVLFENLDPKLVEDQIFGPQYRQGELLGPKYRELLIAVQDSILVDKNVSRVRIWDVTGLLVFSTDRQDEIGQSKTAERSALDAAIDGRTTDSVKAGTLQTVTPLRIPGQLKVHAIAGIEQDVARIVATTAPPTPAFRMPAIVAAVLFLMLFVVATLYPEPPAKPVREAADDAGVTEEREKRSRRAKPEAEPEVRIERVVEPDPAVVAERDRLQADLETAATMIRDLEAELTAVRELAAPSPFSSSEPSGAWLTEDLQKAEQRARTFEESLAVQTDRAETAETKLRAAEERARTAEERAKELEDYFPSIDTAGEERSGDGPSEEQLKEYELTLRNAAVRQLRGPVSRVRGAALALKGEVSSPKGREMMERLDDASGRLDQLVADLESLSRLVDGTLPLRLWSTEVERFVERIVSGWKKDNQREVVVDAQPIAVPVDQARLQQILESLLDDANERVAPEESLQVKVRPHAEGAVIILEAPGDLPQRADLSLALARRFVELHGGRIWYEPRPDATAILVMFPSERTADVWTPVTSPDRAEPAAG